MDNFFVKSKWPKDDLNGRLVEFRFPVNADAGEWTEGIGEFSVLDTPAGLLSIHIALDLPGRHLAERQVVRYSLPQDYADRIEANPPGAEVPFRLFL